MKVSKPFNVIILKTIIVVVVVVLLLLIIITMHVFGLCAVDRVSRVLHVEQGQLVELQGEPRLHHDAIVTQNQETVFTILVSHTTMKQQKVVVVVEVVEGE